MSMHAFIAASKTARESMEKKDAAAKRSGALVGRYLAEPYADGHAYYEIVEDLGPDVRVRVITGICDDWRLPQWGDEAIIPREYAEERVLQRDHRERFFAEHRRAMKPVQAFAKQLEAVLPGVLHGATNIKVHGSVGEDGMSLEVEYEDGEPHAKGEAAVRKALAGFPGMPPLHDLKVRRTWLSRWGHQVLAAKEAELGVQIDSDTLTIPLRPAEHARVTQEIEEAMGTLFGWKKKKKEEPWDPNTPPFQVEVLPLGAGYLAVVTWEDGPEEDAVAKATAGIRAEVLTNRKRTWRALAVEHLRG